MDAKPTVKQVYALAAALCERMGEEFPESKLEASELIQRLRDENGDPRARLDRFSKEVAAAESSD